MPPNAINDEDVMMEADHQDHKGLKPPPREYKIVWVMVIYFTYIHLAGVYGLYLGVTTALWPTILFTLVFEVVSSLGITAGVHRLWTHKSYKAKIPLQIFLMLCQSATNQLTAIHWTRDHLLHHKYTDTDADPYNAKRGLFFSHIGWLLVKKHSEARVKGRLLDLSELYANPVLRFQQKYAVLLISSATFIVPSLIPLLWNEHFSVAYHMNILRVAIIANVVFSVNSFAHLWGTRPYDESILAAQNKIVSFFILGEGFHNYHHVFPHDYRAAELGDNFLNPTTKFIDFCVWIGQASDCKYATNDVIKARMKRTGHKE